MKQRKMLKNSRDNNVTYNPFVRINNSTTGITLIALVITIIILIILVGISIASLTGYGLFEKTQKAKTENDIAREKEQIKIGVMAALANDDEYSEITLDGLNDQLKKYSDISEVKGIDNIPTGAIIVSKNNKKFNLKDLFISTSIATNLTENYKYAKVTYTSGRIYYVGLRYDVGKIWEDPNNSEQEEIIQKDTFYLEYDTDSDPTSSYTKIIIYPKYREMVEWQERQIEGKSNEELEQIFIDGFNYFHQTTFESLQDIGYTNVDDICKIFEYDKGKPTLRDTILKLNYVKPKEFFSQYPQYAKDITIKIEDTEIERVINLSESDHLYGGPNKPFVFTVEKDGNCNISATDGENNAKVTAEIRFNIFNFIDFNEHETRHNTSTMCKYLKSKGYNSGWVVEGLNYYGEEKLVNGDLTKITIPDYFKGKPIIAVSSGYVYDMSIYSNMQEIVLSKSIKAIDQASLWFVSEYGVKPTLNEGLEFIGQVAFGSSNGYSGEESVIQYIKIPDSVFVVEQLNNLYVYNNYSIGKKLQDYQNFGDDCSLYSPRITYFRGTLEELNNIKSFTENDFNLDYTVGNHIYCLEDGKSCYQTLSQNSNEYGETLYEWKEITDMKSFIQKEREASGNLGYGETVDELIMTINNEKEEALEHFLK